MPTERVSEKTQGCPQCGQALHEEPVVVDHALRVGLVCADHGVASIAAPFAP
ncbi:MAG TPA: hypothetical protein VIM40_00830 [Arthrobacter sp.]|jgi:ribosomal protein S27AE